MNCPLYIDLTEEDLINTTTMTHFTGNSVAIVKILFNVYTMESRYCVSHLITLKEWISVETKQFGK